MTAVLLFALLLCLTGCGSAGQPETDEAPAYLVAVTAGETSGSGILYQQDDAYLYVLTAAHVVSCMNPGTEAVLRFFDGQELSCGDIRISEVSDLALIRIPADRISERQRNACLCVPSDKESFDRLQTGDGCTAIGLHAESGALRHEGHILEPWIYMEDYGQYMIWADAEVRPGMSGGGLLDQEGRLIGILSGGSQDGELAAVPLSLILQFMEDMDCASRQPLHDRPWQGQRQEIRKGEHDLCAGHKHHPGTDISFACSSSLRPPCSCGPGVSRKSPTSCTSMRRGWAATHGVWRTTG